MKNQRKTEQSISFIVLMEPSAHMLAMFAEKLSDNPVPTQHTI
jgi:hypothetical protein